MKILNFTNMLNVRDIGGYETKDGSIIKDNLLIRSDAPKEMSLDDVSYLIKHDIVTEIDLRTEEVAAHHPSTLLNYPGFDYMNFPIIEGSQITLTDANVPDLYLQMTSGFKNFKNIFHTIAYCDTGIYLNCTAGKDRTGVIVGLLLELLGVKEQTIIDDYSISESLINKNIVEYRKVNPGFPESLGFSKAKHFKAFLEKFHEKYGTVSHYLQLIGIEETTIEFIKEKFLVKK